MEFLPKNGNVHAYTFSTGGMNLTMAKDSKEANEELNSVLDDLQSQGYDVVDVKMTTTMGALAQVTMRFLVLYK